MEILFRSGKGFTRHMLGLIENEDSTIVCWHDYRSENDGFVGKRIRLEKGCTKFVRNAIRELKIGKHKEQTLRQIILHNDNAFAIKKIVQVLCVYVDNPSLFEDAFVFSKETFVTFNGEPFGGETFD